ncbi:MAG: ATP-dependent Clp protease ATP-binding subunit, partial [candidate division Zixibacteria bacterium]|nr:ATP-dependent Clp protease ATP-binding subunit [candidate division Zixibacteria bacterium]
YRKHIEKDKALERRFQPVMVEEPSIPDCVKILQGLRETFEKFHNLTISDAAIEAACKLSKRYISDRFLPDKAIDLIDETAALMGARS